MDDTIQKARKTKHRLNWLFVGSIAFVEVILLLIIAYSMIRTYFDEISIFSVIALALMLLWLGVVIGYLAWANYFYNINLGLTNESWKELKQKKERADELLAVGENPGEVPELPEDNPYSSQSMGLPPGTIRATLTLTLMIGAISLFIYSMGNSQIDEGDSFIYDNFEFFKTAFLMMIAFYFGSRSLEILKNKPGIITKRFAHRNGNTGGSANAGPSAPAGNLPQQPQAPANAETAAANDANNANTASAPPDASLSSLKSMIETQPIVATTAATEMPRPVEKDYTSKTLTKEQISELAEANGLEAATLVAVTEVESGKSGFLPDGRPRILFEGHKFWKHLAEKHAAGKIDFGPEKFAAENPDILYPSYTRKYYAGGTAEYTRLEKAKLIDRESALLSASWGKFQILGENFKAAGFDTVDQFVEAHYKTEREHMAAFVNFINNTTFQGKNLKEYLQEKNWQKFARAYNGPAYADNQYDLKLEQSYARYATAFNQQMTARLTRLTSNEVQTTGELVVSDKGSEVFRCKTLELPWRDNNINISHIPAGTYTTVKRTSDKYGRHFHLLNVPGRSMILIHAGNYYTDTRGCILVGQDLTDINADGFRDVTSSRLTLGKLNQMLPDRFEITITDHA